MPAGIGAELIAGLLSFLFTLMVLSYLIGDNPAFRLAVYIFIGVSAGYVAAVAWYQVLYPMMLYPLLTGGWFDRLLAFLALVTGILLFTKLSPRFSRLGGPSVALMVGVGAAVAVGGAVLGTLLPQVQAGVNSFDLTQGSPVERLFYASIVMVGTVTTLVYFQFGAKLTPTGIRRRRLVELLGLVGQFFIAVTFGVLFASAYAAVMTALVERLSFMFTFLKSLF